MKDILRECIPHDLPVEETDKGVRFHRAPTFAEIQAIKDGWAKHPRRNEAARQLALGEDKLVLWNAKGQPVPMKDRHRGPVFLVCGGPSLQKLDLSPLGEPGIVSMAVNNAPKAMWEGAKVRPNLWTCVDSTDHFARSIWADPKIEKIVPISRRDERVFDSDQWKATEDTTGRLGNTAYYHTNAIFDPDVFLTEPSVNYGNDKTHGGKRSVMLAAMRLLYHLGFRTVYLLGVDFQMKDGQQNYAFDQDRAPGSIRGNNITYAELQKRFTTLRPLFEKAGLNVYNCNGDSKLTAFPYKSYTTAVGEAREAWGAVDLSAERTNGLYDKPKDKPALIVTNKPSAEPVTVITPTGDRPEAFTICERWMGNQGYAGNIQWIVVDDGQTPTEPTMGQTYVRREPKPDDPNHTLPLNLLAALPHVKHDRIVFIEDDDYYAPGYLSEIVSHLETADLVGLSPTIYYRLWDSTYRTIPHQDRASLCMTAMRGSVVPTLERVCQGSGKFVDLQLWKSWDGSKYIGQSTRPLGVGIKGMPGRRGKTSGWDGSSACYKEDLGGKMLRQWLGDDVKQYCLHQHL